MFNDFYQSLSDDVDRGIDGFLKEAPNMKMNMTNLNKYNVYNTSELGKGTYGVVRKGKIINGQSTSAIKHLKLENEEDGFPITAMREIKLLQTLNHENIVKMTDVCYEMKSRDNRFKMDFHLVFEYCHTDLNKVLRDSTKTLDVLDRRKITYQLLQGINYMHGQKFMHRDLKPANILISSNGIVKIADFGLSRKLRTTENAKYTDTVVTMWYRAPEIFLHIRNYTPAIDIWSLGCIFFELWTRKPLFCADTEYKMFNLIVDVCGSINNNVWPNIEMVLTSLSIEIRRTPSKLLQHLSQFQIDQAAAELIFKTLSYNPSDRPTAEKALNYRYLLDYPLPTGQTSLKMSK